MKRGGPLKTKTPLKRGGTRLRQGRSSRPKMTAARRSAQGQQCLIRLPGCLGGTETTVLAHYRLAGTCGMGIKPDDGQGAYACAYCHDIVDGRRAAPAGYDRDAVRLAHAEGVLRTQALLRGEPT